MGSIEGTDIVLSSDSIRIEYRYSPVQRTTVAFAADDQMTTHQPSMDRSADDETTSDGESQPTTDAAVQSDPAALLPLLGDECTRRVLEAVADQPRSAREVVELVDVSRVTVYRHLDRLEEAGVVDSATVYDANGHHHAEYWAVCEEIVVRFGGDGVELAVRGSNDGSTDDDT